MTPPSVPALLGVLIVVLGVAIALLLVWLLVEAVLAQRARRRRTLPLVHPAPAVDLDAYLAQWQLLLDVRGDEAGAVRAGTARLALAVKAADAADIAAGVHRGR